MLKQVLSYDIAIPVLNEEKRLPHGIAKLYRFLEEKNIKNFTITISDNGSTDGTERVAYQLMKQYPKIKFIKIGQKGVGLALKTAWGKSNADIIGYMDVDLATDIEHLQEVVNLFETTSCDVLNGSRNLFSSRVINRSFLRTLTSRGFNWILRCILNVNFTDGMCGFKFLRRNLYKKLQLIGLENNGWFFCTELLYVAERTGMKIHEIPVKWTDDRDSRVQLTKTIVYYLREILKLRYRKWKNFYE